MKQNILLYVAIVIASFTGNDIFAQSTPTRNDSIATTLRLNGLQAKRDKLQNEIKIQDAKRNKQMSGVAPETLEEINDRQDSICLALRSELVDVILEIKEMSPEVSSPVLLQQYNNLVDRKDKSTPTSQTTPSPDQSDQPAKKPEN